MQSKSMYMFKVHKVVKKRDKQHKERSNNNKNKEKREINKKAGRQADRHTKATALRN